MLKVCCVGEILIDFTPAGISENGNILFERNPGGGPANVAASVATFGTPVSFMGMAGNDDFGKFLRRTLDDRNVDMSGFVFSDSAKTSLAFVQLDESGNRSFSFYRKNGADLMFSEKDINYKLIDECDILHFSSVSMTYEPARSATRKAAEYASSKGKIVSFDPNLRELLWDNTDEAKEVITSMLDYAGILKISGEELYFLTGLEDIKEATEELFNRGIPLIFSTLGPKGCYYKHKNGDGLFKTYDTKVVDTTGSGDAFVGAVLHKISVFGKRLDELSRTDLYEITDFANAAGAMAATGKGGIPSMPTVEQTEECRLSIPLL